MMAAKTGRTGLACIKPGSGQADEIIAKQRIPYAGRRPPPPARWRPASVRTVLEKIPANLVKNLIPSSGSIFDIQLDAQAT